MNIEEKIETPYTSSEEVIGGIRFPYFEPFSSSVFPIPDLVTDNDLLRDNKYESHGEVVPKQTGQSHYLDPFPQLANDQSGFHQAFHHQATSRITSIDYGTPQAINYRNPQAAPDISLSDDSQAQYIRREGSLKSKTTGLGLPQGNNSMGEDLFASWGQLTGPEFRAGYQPSPGSWMATRPFHGNLQSRGEVSGRQRIRWTHELHEQFVDAVNNLGGPTKATPKGILKLMKSPGLTVFHIKSHLQKYRSAKCFPNIHEGRNGKSSICDGMPLCSLRGNGIFHISETLQLQMDVQRSLHEHLEFQKKLQMKIEENANYLQQMLDQQKRSGSYSENHNSNKATDPSNSWETLP